MNKMITVIFSLIIFCSCSDLVIPEEENYSIKMADFNEVWEIVDRQYPFLEFKEIDWNAMYEKYEPRIKASQGDEYMNELINLLSELEDGHVGLETKSGYVRTYYMPRELKDKLSYSPELVRSYFDRELVLTGDGHMNYGTIDNMIGYIRIETWSENDRNWAVDIDKAINSLRTTDGLIIDVRHNGGGCTCLSNVVTSRFIDQPLKVPGIIRNGIFYEGDIIQPNKSAPYENDIVLLINGVSFSATEVFARDMKTIDRVTLVGGTTGGGGGAVNYYDLPSQLKVRLTFQNSLRYDLSPIEWNGIEPDIIIEQSETDIVNGRDKQLEFAIEYLKN